ncbi:hypothetical protein KAR91_31675 [Candidatus Pacearchaeota archaeon]|nr:hypothetical protein [Candidatus Pacearchaeota archaeon]
MDYSVAYINMCKAAKEIQEGWKPETGDDIWIEANHLPAVVKHTKIIEEEYVRLDSHIFTPRQGQLQGMVRTSNTTDLELITRLVHKVKGEDCLDYKYNWSAEQLWLAFVMKEKYGKTWYCETWA